VIETPVGDRNVLDVLEQRNLTLGGEQSGHVIYADHATTGDGTLTGLLLLDVVARTGRPLADLAASAMTRLPQTLVNVRVTGSAPAAAERIAGEVAEAERRLGPTGRVLVRPSGTEPAVRVMVEAVEAEQAQRTADRLAAAVRAAG